MMIVNWILGLVSFFAVVGIVTFPILAIIFGIKESRKAAIQGQTRYKKTILFVILTVVSFFALVLGLVLWGVGSYMFSVAPSVM